MVGTGGAIDGVGEIADVSRVGGVGGVGWIGVGGGRDWARGVGVANRVRLPRRSPCHRLPIRFEQHIETARVIRGTVHPAGW